MLQSDFRHVQNTSLRIYCISLLRRGRILVHVGRRMLPKELDCERLELAQLPRPKLTDWLYTIYPIVARALGIVAKCLHAINLCSRDALGLKAADRPSAARDDRVSCIQAECAREQKYLAYKHFGRLWLWSVSPVNQRGTQFLFYQNVPQLIQ